MSAEGTAAPTKWIDRPGVRRFIGRVLIGTYIKFVRATSRVVADPPDFWEAAQKDHWPAIAVSWHGQSNLAYVVMPIFSGADLRAQQIDAFFGEAPFQPEVGHDCCDDCSAA